MSDTTLKALLQSKPFAPRSGTARGPWRDAPGARPGGSRSPAPALARVGAAARARPELCLLLLVAALLNLWGLDRNGWANEYYSAAVHSMGSSLHAFLYGSFDAAGVMTVDKPPLALWVQTLSAELLGFNSWGLLVPQALMGVATVALAYDMTRRRFGRAAGFAAGLVLALTPVSVAIFRHNNPDALLVLCCTAAVWFIVRGLEDGRTRWVVLSGVCVGLGFEAKMAAVLMVVPALAAAWMWVAPRGRLTALRQLLAGGAAMTAVGLAWPVLVWLTPAADRPWVSGTSDNSIWSLILGYNGLGRVLGQDGGPGGGGAGGGPGGGMFGGDTGLLRLLNESVGGQAGWLLGFALVGGVAVLATSRLRRGDARTGWLIAVGGTFVTAALAFSFAEGIFHPYYVAQLAPFGAALVGAGAVELARGGRAGRILAPLAVAAGVGAELIILGENPGQLGWLTPVLIVLGALAAAAVAGGMATRLRAVVVAAALALLLLAPASWAVGTLGHATSATFPAGGPASAGLAGGPGGAGPGGGPPPGPGTATAAPGAPLAPPGAPSAGSAPATPPGAAAGVPGSATPGGGTAGSAAAAAAPTGGGMPGGPSAGGGGMFGGDSQALSEAVAYAEEHGGGAVAVSSQSGAAGQLITSGADVVAIGGFSGRESQVSAAWLADAIADGRIRWVLVEGGGGSPQDGRVGSSAVMALVQQVGEQTSVDGLYDLRGKAGELRAAAG